MQAASCIISLQAWSRPRVALIFQSNHHDRLDLSTARQCEYHRFFEYLPLALGRPSRRASVVASDSGHSSSVFTLRSDRLNLAADSSRCRDLHVP